MIRKLMLSKLDGIEKSSGSRSSSSRTCCGPRAVREVPVVFAHRKTCPVAPCYYVACIVEVREGDCGRCVCKSPSTWHAKTGVPAVIAHSGH